MVKIAANVEIVAPKRVRAEFLKTLPNDICLFRIVGGWHQEKPALSRRALDKRNDRMGDLSSPPTPVLVVLKQQLPRFLILFRNAVLLEGDRRRLAERCQFCGIGDERPKNSLSRLMVCLHKHRKHPRKASLDAFPTAQRLSDAQVQGVRGLIAFVALLRRLPKPVYWGNATQRYASAIVRPSLRSLTVAQVIGPSLWPFRPLSRPTVQALRRQDSSFVVGHWSGLWLSPRSVPRAG